MLNAYFAGDTFWHSKKTGTQNPGIACIPFETWEHKKSVKHPRVL